MKTKPRGFTCVVLDNPKDPLNVGHVLRAATCYNANLVVISGDRFTKKRNKVRAKTDTTAGYRHIPTMRCLTDDLYKFIPYDCVPVAVDIIPGAIPLFKYVHPERAFYIFGAEDATLGERITNFCRDVIYVPTSHCMNLAAAVNVVLYDRMAKSNK